MKTLETNIKINASANQVWNVLRDFKSYPEWNPFVTSITGKPAVGTQLETSIELDAEKPQFFKPEVLVVDKNKELRWIGKLFVKGLFDGEHYFQIIEAEDGVEFIHGEKFSGVLVAPIMSLIGEKTESGFKAMNEALKNRVESNIKKS